MVVFPGCKINIGLNITGKRDDGYHDLESIFYPLNLTDVLEMVPDDHFSIHTSGLPIDGDHSDNLVVKAYYLLQDQYKLPPVKIHLHKVVPMGGGLGGGSADGAAALVLLNRLFNLKISDEKLEEYAAVLGSDCPFFIKSKPAFVEGRGEILTPIELNLSGYYIKLINPGIHISTKTAFSGIKPENSNGYLKTLSPTQIQSWKGEVFNDFEKTIFPHHTEIEKIKKQLQEEGAIYASMTGTGASVYGIFKTEPGTGSTPYFEWTDKLN